MENTIRYCKNVAVMCCTLILAASTFLIVDITVVEIIADIVKLKFLLRTCYAW